MNPHYFCYLNNQILSFSEASIQLNDLGLLRGFGVFDYFKTHNGAPFYMEKHLARFENSVNRIGLELPFAASHIAEIIDELLFMREDKSSDCAFRLVFTAGNSENGISVGIPNFFILTEDLAKVPAEHFERGIKVLAYNYVRQFADIKTTFYLPVLLQQKQMQTNNASDLLYHYQGKISECTRSNFFIFKDDILITPNEAILEGITRNIVLHMATKEFEIQVREVFLEELQTATEAFKTGTTSQITPITQMDDLKIGNGNVGKNTKRLMEMWAKLQQ